MNNYMIADYLQVLRPLCKIQIKYRMICFYLAPCFLFLIGTMIFIFKVPIIPFPKEDAGIILSGPDTFVLDDTLKCVKQENS